MIGVGVIGAGAAALTAHLPALHASDRFRLSGICDTSGPRLDEALKRFPAAGFVSPEVLLAQQELDAVVIATPPQTHAGLAANAIRRGKHVLCEKPLAPTVEECRHLVSAADEAGVVFGVAHEKRFHPDRKSVV